MEWRRSVEIAAPPSRVWQVLTDVEAWPEWTPSVCSVVRVDAGPLQVGQRLRISQPRLPTTVWRLAELVEERACVWHARSLGATVVTRHEIALSGPGTLATLSLAQRGPLGVAVGALISRMNHRYLEMETRGLKEHCER